MIQTSDPGPAETLPANPLRWRQQVLFPVSGPLSERLGSAFFKRLPAQPGVYFFYDGGGRLLYIGQSCCLRDRIGSYRFVSERRHARRTGRLVRRTVRIEWKTCETPEAAVALEATLLREYHPPFNRAGVWEPPPVWIFVEGGPGFFRVCLLRSPQGASAGPLPSSFRSVYPALMRCLYRFLHPGLTLWDLPAGMSGVSIPPEHSWSIRGDGSAVAAGLRHFVSDWAEEWIETLQPLAGAAPVVPPQHAFWQEEIEGLRKYSLARRKQVGQ